jgi:hypothetical protein
VSSGYSSANGSLEISNNGTVPSDGDDGTAASVDVQLEIHTDDIKALRNRFALNEATTFVEPGDGAGSVASAGNVAGEFTCAGWQLDRRLLHANNDTAGLIRRSFDGGYTWSSEHTVGASGAYVGIASQTDSSAAILVFSSAGEISLTGPGNAWTETLLTHTGTAVPGCIVADPFNASTYWIGGLDGTTPVVWQIVSVNGVSPPTQTKIALTGGVAGVNVICPGRNQLLAASNDSGTSHLWSITGGVATVVTPPSTTFIVDILWLDAFSKWLLVASNGSSTLELWTSPSGATGTWTALSSSYLISLESASFVVNSVLRGACIVGPLAGGTNAPCTVIIPISLVGGATVQALLVSPDGGATWKTLPDPLARHQSVSPLPTAKRCRVINNRVMAFTYQAAGKVYHALSSRGGLPV